MVTFILPVENDQSEDDLLRFHCAWVGFAKFRRRLSLVFADRPLIFGLLWITVRVWTISHTTQLWRVLCNRHLDDSRNDPRLETLPHHDDHLLPEKSRHTGPVYDVCCALMLAAGIRYHSTAQWKTASLVSVTFNNVKYPPWKYPPPRLALQKIWKLTLTRTPYRNRPLTRGPDPNRPTRRGIIKNCHY